ncbi:TAP-like protein-domain-containing protein [Chaetomidium leptoderma]|uniref:TAP-like protein-domain-containing protein n=1 Tax=Chaetomidium leptoderma TaxID=669021 RepID=A0AAN6VJ93_9PEZI|nr:TAP-like protein-domain-containing protein [Chaetomidium leptoderma]
MVLFRLFTQLALASGALATPLYSRDSHTPQGITWGPCDFETTGSGPIECGTLSVPLDYTNATSSEKLTLSLIKSPSRSKTKTVKKSILFNFGGPGYEAIHSLNGVADYLHLGLGKTLTFSCFDNATERVIAASKYPLLPTDAYERALVDTYANMQALTNVCQEKNKGSQNPEFLGTAFVARDLMSVVDALGEDGLLRFWGFSYGSLLGATVAAMFPSRMDRVILDGVVNARNYYYRLGIDVDQLLSADDAFRAVLSQCIEAGPDKCALASVNSNAADLETTLLRVADDFGKSPVAAGTTVINSRLVMELYFVVIKYTSGLATTAMHINNLVAGTNLTEVADYYNSLMTGVAMGDDDAFYGIKCSDTFPRAYTLSDLMPDVERIIETSEIFGASLAGLTTQCATWPWKAKEMYSGPFEGIKTKSPVLFFGNTYDPVTPLANAKNMSAGFEGSVFVEQYGFGHATISQFSNCTAQIVQTYFANGTLPASGTVCEVNSPLFG